jgi:hypothetical protein
MPPKIVYPARDPAAPYFKSNPTVPKFEPTSFTRWRDEFVRFNKHLVQQTKFIEYKSIIEAHPPGTEVDQCRDDELSKLVAKVHFQPRGLVAECADEFTKALTSVIRVLNTLLSAGLPMTYWSYALRYAAHVDQFLSSHDGQPEPYHSGIPTCPSTRSSTPSVLR